MKDNLPKPWTRQELENLRLGYQHGKARIDRAHAIAIPAVLEDLERFYEAVEQPEIESSPSTDTSTDSAELSIRDRLLHATRYTSLVYKASLRDSSQALRQLIQHLEHYLEGEDFPENGVIASLDSLAHQISHATLWDQAAQGVVVRKQQDVPTPHEVKIMLRKLRAALDDEE